MTTRRASDEPGMRVANLDRAQEVMSAPHRHHVVLVGMMGAGKTTVGRALAARLGRPMVDSDVQVQARTGRTVAEIFETDGEAAFRAEETAALAEALGSPTPAVVAAAGGSVLDPANRELMRRRGDLVVWLRADPSVLARRVHPGDHRPLLADDPAGALRRLDELRRPFYGEVADLVVDIDRRTVGETVTMIAAALATGRS